jgi:hypothetical protein
MNEYKEKDYEEMREICKIKARSVRSRKFSAHKWQMVNYRYELCVNTYVKDKYISIIFHCYV